MNDGEAGAVRQAWSRESVKWAAGAGWQPSRLSLQAGSARWDLYSAATKRLAACGMCPPGVDVVVCCVFNR